MFPNIIKSSKATYLYDVKSKEFIYISVTRGGLYKLTPGGDNIGKYLLGKNRFYLDQFIISDHLLNDDTYSANLKSEGDLFAYLGKLSLLWRENKLVIISIILENLVIQSNLDRPLRSWGMILQGDLWN